MSDDGSVISRGTGKSTTVSYLFLDVAHDGTLEKLGNSKDVSNSQGSLLSAIYECTSVQTLSGNESLCSELVAVGVTEDNAGERSATTSVVNNFFYNSTDVSIALRVVEVAEFCRGLVVVGVRFELKKFVNKSQDIHNNA